MKKNIIILLSLIFLSSKMPIVLAQEYTAYNGPSDHLNESKNKGVYLKKKKNNKEVKYVETREKLDPQLLKNIIESKEINTNTKKEEISEYLNYNSWQFWFLVSILLLIIITLFRLFKKLSKINAKIRRYKDYLQELQNNKISKISTDDEIIYSEPTDD